jgi:hypothetical protein
MSARGPHPQPLIGDFSGLAAERLHVCLAAKLENRCKGIHPDEYVSVSDRAEQSAEKRHKMEDPKISWRIVDILQRERAA